MERQDPASDWLEQGGRRLEERWGLEKGCGYRRGWFDCQMDKGQRGKEVKKVVGGEEVEL